MIVRSWPSEALNIKTALENQCSHMSEFFLKHISTTLCNWFSVHPVIKESKVKSIISGPKTQMGLLPGRHCGTNKALVWHSKISYGSRKNTYERELKREHKAPLNVTQHLAPRLFQGPLNTYNNTVACQSVFSEKGDRWHISSTLVVPGNWSHRVGTRKTGVNAEARQANKVPGGRWGPRAVGF